MKKVFGYLFVACMFSLALGMTSCKKGDAGPAGPEGPKGDSGVAGNAGIIYSGWLDATFDINASGTGYEVEIPAAKITDDILNKGEVKVYTQYYDNGNLTTLALPFFNGSYILNVELFKGGIRLYSNADFSSGTDEDGKPSGQYRYVIIPGGQSARKAQIDWNNYEQVKTYLGLKD